MFEGDSHDLCDTGAVLYQLSYQAKWELVIFKVKANWDGGGSVEIQMLNWSFIISEKCMVTPDFSFWYQEHLLSSAFSA